MKQIFVLDLCVCGTIVARGLCHRIFRDQKYKIGNTAVADTEIEEFVTIIHLYRIVSLRTYRTYRLSLSFTSKYGEITASAHECVRGMLN